MSSNPLPCQQYISGVSAQNGAQVAVGNFYGNVQFGSTEDPQKAYEEKVSACRNALFLTNPHVDRESLISTKGMRVAGTCEWITQNGTYQSWLHSDSHLLWIYGGPGKGKTMLSIFLTEELETATHNTEDTELLFYFCSHQDEKRNTAVAILRGLLYQIVAKHSKLVEHVLPYFDTAEKARQTLSSLETLWIIFRRLIQDVDLGTMFCLLDGLDECDEDGLRVLVPKLVDMFSQPPTKTFKLVIISRDIPGLRGCTHVDLDCDNEERVASDIERFISDRVEKLSRIEGFNNEFRATVQNTLLERSQGTFLWIGFVMNELSQKRTCTEVLETVENLPSGLPAIYSRMLLQVNSEHRRTSSMLLRWVATAFRPLTLQELAAAIGIQSSSTLITTERAIRDEIALCGPFLKIQEQEVSLVHQSAKDYLMRKEAESNLVLEEFRIKPEKVHLELARTCFDCVAHSGLQYASLNIHDRSYQHESPLLNYAALHWPKHARYCSTLAAELFDLSNPFFGKHSDLRKNWWTTYRRDELWSGPSILPLLHTASYLGIVPWVRALVGGRAWIFWSLKPVEEKDHDGWTALHWAASGGHEAVVRLLLDRGVDVNAANNAGRTVLDRAASQGHEPIVRLLLDRGANVNATDKPRLTPLHRAALGGHEAVVRLLLDRGANVDAANNVGQTVLHMAVVDGYGAVVRLLLDRGVDVNATNYDGQTALHRAAAGGHDAVVRLLLDRGANVNATNYDGQTALHRAAAGGHDAAVRLLLDHGVNVNATDKGGWTALHRAASRGREAAVRLLLGRGANVNAATNVGQTALHRAASGGHEAVARLLLDHGANVDATNNAGQTALHMAAINGYEVVVRLLLDRGANVNATADDGGTALGWAASKGYEAIVRQLLDRGVNVNATNYDGQTALHRAASGGHEVVVRLLLDHGAIVSATNNAGPTALHMAAINGYEVVVRLLLDRGANVSATDKDGWTALGWAASRGHEAMVQLLLDCGADVNAMADAGWTALGWAASRGHQAMVQLLLDRGANVNATDDAGWTVLHRAASEGHEAVVKLLLNRGADANAKDGVGWTALHWATSRGHVAVVQLLK